MSLRIGFDMDGVARGLRDGVSGRRDAPVRPAGNGQAPEQPEEEEERHERQLRGDPPPARSDLGRDSQDAGFLDDLEAARQWFGQPHPRVDARAPLGGLLHHPAARRRPARPCNGRRNAGSWSRVSICPACSRSAARAGPPPRPSGWTITSTTRAALPRRHRRLECQSDPRIVERPENSIVATPASWGLRITPAASNRRSIFSNGPTLAQSNPTLLRRLAALVGWR